MVAQRRDDEGRDELKQMIDDLPASEIPAARRMLGYLREVGTQTVEYSIADAPIDDEPLTEEDIAALELSRAEVERGDVVSLDDLRRELSL